MPSLLPESLLMPHGPTSVQWRRSARAQRISLRIDARAGGVVVTLPVRAAKSAGQALLMNNAGWVAERLARLPTAISFADGSAFPLGGVSVRIGHAPGRRGVVLEGDVLRVGGAAEFLSRRVADWLRATARQQLGAAALAKAAAAGLRVRRVVVKDTRTRWGSCTADATLMFNWRLVMAPPEVQDYVVGHEVAHLRHMDHGAGFWALVGELTPHRDGAKRWLEASGAGLMRTG